MKYNVGSYTPCMNDEKRFFIYADGDVNRKVCMMLNEYNTEYASNLLADLLNKMSSKVSNSMEEQING